MLKWDLKTPVSYTNRKGKRRMSTGWLNRVFAHLLCSPEDVNRADLTQDHRQISNSLSPSLNSLTALSTQLRQLSYSLDESLCFDFSP